MNKQLLGDGTAKGDKESNWLTCLHTNSELPTIQLSDYLFPSAPWNSNSVITKPRLSESSSGSSDGSEKPLVIDECAGSSKKANMSATPTNSDRPAANASVNPLAPDDIDDASAAMNIVRPECKRPPPSSNSSESHTAPCKACQKRVCRCRKDTKGQTAWSVFFPVLLRVSAIDTRASGARRKGVKPHEASQDYYPATISVRSTKRHTMVSPALPGLAFVSE